MPEKKNQHYVPKLYLKNFSCGNDMSSIGFFQRSAELYRASVPLKSQAQEDYFYGKDGFIEDELAKLESLAAPVLKTIIAENRLPDRISERFLSLFVFTIFMAHRTKDIAEEINDTFDEISQLLFQHNEEWSQYVIRHTNPAAFGVSIAAKAIPLTLDLKSKLIINKTERPFITSDNPVVKHNQFLADRNHPGGHLGLASKGLQLFFPISPKHLIVLYDDWAYKIGAKSQKAVELNNVKDVDKLNRLQILNSVDILFFNQDIQESYIRSIHNDWKSTGESKRKVFNIQYTSTDPGGTQKILSHGFKKQLHTNLYLSFILQTKKAKRFELSNEVVQLRKAGMREHLELMRPKH